MADLEARLDEIERSLDAGSYRPGPWQELLAAAQRATPADLAALEATITRVSDKLHRRRDPRSFAFERALGLEILAALTGLVLLSLGAGVESPVLLVVAAIVLATSLQPLFKIATGLYLGLAFSYAYLWHGEPRFKLRYGTYLTAARWKRVVFHLAGTLGSPLAWFLVAVVGAPSHPTLGSVFGWLAGLHLLFQAVLFALALGGVQRIPAMGLLRLTSPGAAGYALRPVGGAA